MSEQISTGCRLSLRHGRVVNDVGEDGVEGLPLRGGCVCVAGIHHPLGPELGLSQSR
jgi:hypothetical protein